MRTPPRSLPIVALSAALLFGAAQPLQAEPTATVQKKPATAEELAARSRASQAFLEGSRLLEHDQFAEALAQFRLAAEYKDTPGVRYHIAFCLESLGSLVEAADEYERAAALLERQTMADVAQLLPEAQQRVEAAIPQLTFQNLAPGAQVLVDDQPVDALAPVRVNPGAHQLVVTAPQHEELRLELQVEPSEHRVVEAQQRQLPKPVAPVPIVREQAPSSNARPLVFWTFVGVAGTGVAVGVTGLVLAENAQQEVTRLGNSVDQESGGDPSACNGSAGSVPTDCSALQDAMTQKRDALTVGVVGFSVFGAGVVSALLTHFLWEDAPVQLAVQPEFVAPHAAPVLAGGRFQLTAEF